MEDSKNNVTWNTQQVYMDLVRKTFQNSNIKPRYYILTMGCQMNSHDSEKLAGILEEMGYLKASQEDDADFVLYNTCCVRENAENKVYGKLGQLKHKKEKNPHMIIAICGCMMQQQTVVDKLCSTYRQVDIIFGTHNILRLPELLHSFLTSKKRIVDIWEEGNMDEQGVPSLLSNKVKASVNIMYGCNNFCTYCIVPYVRGREKSREVSGILEEVRSLVQAGVKEITLLGQNVNSYGKTLLPPVTFAKLLQQVSEVDGLERIRFMTSHPKDLSAEVIDVMRNDPKLCKSLHLPVQSGSTRVLKAMNRHYTKEEYLHLISTIRSAMPDIYISTDIIVGFPSETEEDFLETLEIVEKVRFSQAFTFLYSKRNGTPAAEMPCQVSEEVAKERFDRLLASVNRIAGEINETQVGKTFPVLVEGFSKDAGMLTGRLCNNTAVHFAGEQQLIGSSTLVKIKENKIFYLIGERVG